MLLGTLVVASCFGWQHIESLSALLAVVCMGASLEHRGLGLETLSVAATTSTSHMRGNKSTVQALLLLKRAPCKTLWGQCRMVLGQHQNGVESDDQI